MVQSSHKNTSLYILTTGVSKRASMCNNKQKHTRLPNQDQLRAVPADKRLIISPLLVSAHPTTQQSGRGAVSPLACVFVCAAVPFDSFVSLLCFCYPSFDKFANFDKKHKPSIQNAEYITAASYFGQFVREEVVLRGHKPSKVEVSPSANRVFFGGDVLGYLEQQGGRIGAHVPMYNLKSCTLKALPQDEILVNDFQSWDLVLFDYDLREKGRLQGGVMSQSARNVKGGPPELYKSIYTRTGSDHRFLLWLKSISDIAVVELGSLTSKSVKEFWLLQSTNPPAYATPVAVTCTSDGKRVFGIGESTGTSRAFQTFHLADGRGGLFVAETQRILPTEIEALTCLEVSTDQQVVFLGGSLKMPRPFRHSSNTNNKSIRNKTDEPKETTDSFSVTDTASQRSLVDWWGEPAVKSVLEIFLDYRLQAAAKEAREYWTLYEEAKKELQIRVAAIHDLERDLRAAQDAFRRADEELHQIQNAYALIERAKGDLEEELRRLRAELDRLQNENRVLREQLNTKDTLIRRLESDNASFVRTIEIMKPEIEDLRKQVEALKAKVRSLESEIILITEESQSIIQEWNQERQRIIEENSRLQAVSQDRLVEIERKSAENGKLLLRLAMAYAEVERLCLTTVV